MSQWNALHIAQWAAKAAGTSTLPAVLPARSGTRIVIGYTTQPMPETQLMAKTEASDWHPSTVAIVADTVVPSIHWLIVPVVDTRVFRSTAELRLLNDAVVVTVLDGDEAKPIRAEGHRQIKHWQSRLCVAVILGISLKEAQRLVATLHVKKSAAFSVDTAAYLLTRFNGESAAARDAIKAFLGLGDERLAETLDSIERLRWITRRPSNLWRKLLVDILRCLPK